MRRGFDIGGKYREDPVGADVPRGKSTERRKHRNDGTSWTPTEARLKNELMRQFMHNPEGTAHADDDAYKNSPAWCPHCDGRRLRDEGYDCCTSCRVRRQDEVAMLGGGWCD
jgi:hypothetical protein